MFPQPANCAVNCRPRALKLDHEIRCRYRPASRHQNAIELKDPVQIVHIVHTKSHVPRIRSVTAKHVYELDYIRNPPISLVVRLRVVRNDLALTRNATATLSVADRSVCLANSSNRTKTLQCSAPFLKHSNSNKEQKRRHFMLKLMSEWEVNSGTGMDGFNPSGREFESPGAPSLSCRWKSPAIP
jgi:hypothetical protein